MPLAADRNTPRREGGLESHPVLASTKIYAGALVCLNAAGWAVPGAAATTLIALGRADAQADNSDGANGAIQVQVRRGIFHWKNSASTDLIARAEIGDDCFVVDDETVAKTNGSSTRSIAGKIIDVDAQGVWVES